MKAYYTAKDIENMEHLQYAQAFHLPQGTLQHHVCAKTVDDQTVCRIFHSRESNAFTEETWLQDRRAFL